MAVDTATWQYLKGRNVSKVIVDWVSHSTAGTVSQKSDEPIYGEVLRITTNPGATAPTVNYDITLPDEDSVDIALGTLANRHNSNTETVYPTVAGSAANSTDVQFAVAGYITLTIANAGNSKIGKVTIYLRR